MNTKDFIAGAVDAYAPQQPTAADMLIRETDAEAARILAACPVCDWTPEGITADGKAWGYVGSPSWMDRCEHLIGELRCDCCSENWYRVGDKSTHDYSWEGEESGYKGGPAKEHCPPCEEWHKAGCPEEVKS